MQETANFRTADKIELLMESSWEVCNKIGGIYTVLSTKARVLHRQLGDRLVFIGPDVWPPEKPSPYFVEKKTLLKSASTRMRLPLGLQIRVGRWDIPGSPLVVLVKFDTLYPELPRIYGEMWKDYGVDSLHSYGDYDEGCAFAVASAIVMQELAHYMGVDGNKVICHFNEWTTGMGLLWLKRHMPEAATVFTAHATCIGRSICGNGKPLYDYFEGYYGDQMARELNMESKHSLEKAAAHQADCFTAVSELTARECGQLLDIRPQVVTPNGFEPDFVPGSRVYARQRQQGRERLLRIGSLLKGRNLSPDTMLVATSGRNEYRNKGLDIYLDALARLERLDSTEHTSRDVLAFVLVPSWVKEPVADLSFDLDYHGDAPVYPDYLTHRLNNEESDAVACRVRSLEENGNFNGKVNVVYVPCYLDGDDGIVNIKYYDLLPALDLTIFPSYYEPWGYTPLESIAFGVPTVTSDKSGFGQWISGNFNDDIYACGVKVIARTDSNYEIAAEAIACQIATQRDATAAEIAEAREAAVATAAKADWALFIEHYDKAFEVAQTNASERQIKH